ncbi:MAG TPA: c-type cytochrome [Candidatus Saccharimonadales bacterium]|jgi:mono/diheme cytochrome c family protein|nr:c-type cytochrome [Candidatus Saccharimonadales bacterium]
MRATLKNLLALTALLVAAASTQASPALHEKRQSLSDLEVSGALVALPPDSVRYITREDLLAMPQVRFNANGDSNFTGSAKIRGVKLEDLARAIGASPASVMVVAICDDQYRANYPQAYLKAHHPVLVLEVNGKAPAGWPKDSQEHKYDMGPYMISNPKFGPSYKMLSHEDEPQIPWGVVRIEFRDEKTVFDAIAPRGSHAQDREVQDGFGIAKQNCFRCHNSGREGGQKSGAQWETLSALAASSPKDFAAYIHEPVSRNPNAQMPGFPEYDNAALAALTAYFQTFSQRAKP